jgi:hypothetical protein
MYQLKLAINGITEKISLVLNFEGQRMTENDSTIPIPNKKER